MTLRNSLTIRPGQTAHFYSMPGWWVTLVLLSAVLTGIGIGQVQEGPLPGAFTLTAGVALTGLCIFLRLRAKGRDADGPDR